MKKILKIFSIILIIGMLCIPFFSCKKKEEKEQQYVNTDKIHYIGYYPQFIAKDISIDDIKTGIYDENTSLYLYNSNFYLIIKAKPYRVDKNAIVKFSDGTIIEDDKEYAFLVEPIKWNVLKREDKKLTLVSDYVIDGQDFNSDVQFITDRYYIKDSLSIYANNYQYSQVRTFLNDYFYKSAFSDDDKNKILKTKVDNTEYIFGNKDYQSRVEDTQDYVYLPSQVEIQSSLFLPQIDTNGKLKLKQATDFAIARGVYYDINVAKDLITKPAGWMTRTPAKKDKDMAQLIFIVANDGSYDSNKTSSTKTKDSGYCGVVPMIVISD